MTPSSSHPFVSVTTSGTIPRIAVPAGAATAVSAPARAAVIVPSRRTPATAVASTAPTPVPSTAVVVPSSSTRRRSSAGHPLSRPDLVHLFLLPAAEGLLLLSLLHLALLFLEQCSRYAKRVRLGREEQVPQGLHEGGRFRFEEPGQEDLHVFRVDDLCMHARAGSARELRVSKETNAGLVD